MADKDTRNYLDLETDKFTRIAPGSVQVRDVTIKPPVRRNYATDELFKEALEQHYQNTPYGVEVEEHGMTLQTDRIIFPDQTFMTTAAVGGGSGSSLELSTSNTNSTLSANNPSSISRRMLGTGSGALATAPTYGINELTYLPGGNGKGNALPENCDRFAFLSVNMDLSTIAGGSANTRCYVPVYFKAISLQMSVGYGQAYTEDEVSVNLFEGNIGVLGGTPSPALYPSATTLKIRVSPPPSDDSTVITLNENLPSVWANVLGRLNTFTPTPSNLRLTQANNWTVTYNIEIANDDELNLGPVASFINFTTSSSSSAYNNLQSNNVTIQLFDYEDFPILRDPPWENKANQIAAPGSAFEPQVYFDWGSDFPNNTRNQSTAFSLAVEYVTFGETSTTVNTTIPFESTMDSTMRSQINAWKSNLGGVSGLDRRTTVKIFENITIDPVSGKWFGTFKPDSSVSELYQIEFQTKPDSNEVDDEDDTNNRSYPVLIYMKTPNGFVSVQGKGVSGDPIKTFSANPDNSTYFSATIQHIFSTARFNNGQFTPGNSFLNTPREIITFFIFANLVDGTTSDNGNGNGNGGESGPVEEVTDQL